MSIEKQKLSELRTAIGNDGIKVLAEKLQGKKGCSRPAISAVMNGIYYNKAIIDAAIELADARKKMYQSVEKRIKKAVA